MPTDAIPKHVRNLPAVIQQPQIMPEMRHCSQDRGGGGQAALARDLHRAGAQERQHYCVHTRPVRCEDLDAEERIVMTIERLRDEVQDDHPE